MNNWQELLRDADPVREPGPDARLSVDDVRHMRNAVVAAARVADRRPSAWAHALAMAAILVLMIGVGVVAGRQAAQSKMAALDAARTEASQAPEIRQLQFATPGGTRIIWVFNPDFDRKETIP